MHDALQRWAPPEEWRRIVTLDAHTGGEPLRIIVSGFPELKGKTILDRRQFLRDMHDALRTTIMWEPRGHREMYGCLVTPAVTAGSDFGVLFMHNEGYSTMCGHGIIAITTVAVETGMIPRSEPETVVRIDTPAGQITARAHVENGRVTRVCFRNVPSFVVELGASVNVPGMGRITYDLAFGGAFYAYVDAAQAGVTCTPDAIPALVEKGMAIKRAVMASREIHHPVEPDLGFLYGTIFISPPLQKGAHSRNVCVFADGEVDRSPTGTGVSGRMAIHFARKEVLPGQPITIESVIGSRFIGRVAGRTIFGPYAAVLPEVEGSAHITGRSEFWVDPEDPLGSGFLL